MSVMKALVFRTAGTNCDGETAQALRLAGADPDVIHINRVVSGEISLDDYRIVVVPGGFSWGDDVAAGKILANELRFKLGDVLEKYISSGRRLIGVCNGFQVLVKTGFLPGNPARQQTVTLAHNDSGQFQCHWVSVKREKSTCSWLNATDTEWDLPIAHGEGKFLTLDKSVLTDLEKNDQIVFRYAGSNPNGSQNSIAGICNKEGNVVGLMPHPERHVTHLQHPEWTRLKRPQADPVGLQFWKAAVQRWN